MICDKCGSTIPDGSIFCTSCGAKLGVKPKADTFTQADAKDELAKANEAAQDTVALANEEAAKVAREYSEAVSKAGEGFDEAASETLPVLTGEPLPMETGENLPAEVSEDVQALNETGTELAEAVAEGEAEGNEQLPAENIQPQKQEIKKVEKTPSSEIKEGKSIPAAMIIIAAVGLVVLVVALVFLISGSARNSVKRMFMSDEDYFKSVEKNAILDLADDLGDAYEDDFVGIFDFMKSKYTMEVDVTVKDEAEDFLEAIYKKNRDVDLSWIKQAQAEMSFQMKDKLFQAEGEVSVNKRDLANFDYIGNLNENKYYLGIPILSKEYAKYDLSQSFDLDSVNLGGKTFNIQALVDSTAFKDALPSKKEMQNILSRYMDIALSKVKRIKFYEDQALEAGGVKDRYLMISAEIDEDLQPEIIDAILKELSKDDEVLAIINRIEKTGVFGDAITADSFLDWIEEYQDNVYNMQYKYMTLNVWVDDTGKVVGQQLVDDNATGYTYKYVINGGNFGFEAFYTRKNKVKENIVASGTISGSSVTGNLKVYNSSGYEQLSLDFSDIDVIDLLQGNPTGTLLLDVYDMTEDRQFKGLKLNVEFNLSLKKSTARFLVSDSGKTIIEADVTLKKSSAGTVKEPTKVLEVDKNNNLGAWVKNFDWDTVLKNADKAKMPSRYYRQLEKWSETDANSLFSSWRSLLPFSNLLFKIRLNNMSEADLYDYDYLD